MPISNLNLNEEETQDLLIVMDDVVTYEECMKSEVGEHHCLHCRVAKLLRRIRQKLTQKGQNNGNQERSG